MIDCPVLFDGAEEWLEPDAGRLARPVLRGSPFKVFAR